MKATAQRILLIAILAGIVAGGLAGWYLGSQAIAIGFLGDIFLNALKMLVVPLVVCSMIVGVSALGDVRKVGRTGIATLIYYTITTAIAVGLGIVLVTVIHPGSVDFQERAPADLSPELRAAMEPVPVEYEAHPGRWRFLLMETGGRDAAEAVLAEPVPPYFARMKDGPALFRQLAATSESSEAVRAKYRRVQSKRGQSAWAGIREVLLGLFPPNLIDAAARTQVLPLIVFSLLFGGVLTTLGARGQPALDFFRSCNDAILKLVQLLMWYAPVGIFALVAARIGAAGGGDAVLAELRRIGWYALTVIVGLTLHGVIVLPILLRTLGRRSIFSYVVGSSPALLTAFSTASSSATLPTSLRCAQDGNGVSRKAAGFVLPLGATVNMDGTALYEAVAVIFVAQTLGMELSGAQQLVVFLTATLAAIGAAGIPEAGLVTMVMVFEAVGIPLEGMAMILAIDWFLDRCRTTVNVWGDLVGAAVIEARIPEAREEASGDSAPAS